MFSKMLVATDLSAASDKVICALGGLKALGTRETLLVYCFGIRDVGCLADRVMELVTPAFEQQKKTLEGLGYQTEARMVLGSPHGEINRIASENRCDLIVVGSQGQTMASELMLGGVASAVVHSATKPVLVLRMRLKDDADTSFYEVAPCHPLEHVLFPTDFSDNAEHAFSYVEKIAACGAKRVTLLHVQDLSRIERHLKERLEEFNRIDTERLGRLKDELTKRGVRDVVIEIPYGSPKHEVIERTRKGDVSLVVMGSQGRGYVGDLFLGSVSHAVVRHAATSVLLIPAVR